MNQSAPETRILIVGGGTAGWMTATLLAQAWSSRGISVSLLESSTIGTIGVGEGSTPKMRRFFDRLGISESEWMPPCHASYKCGIRFPGWSSRKGFKSYYHPFFSHADDSAIRAFYQNATLRSRNLDVAAHPDAFFVSNQLAREGRAPVAATQGDYTTDYAYHFDAGRIGDFLKAYATKRGVTHLIDTVTVVNRHESGAIKSVGTQNLGDVYADFFIDCTGFAGLLIGKTLNVPFQSFRHQLFNDRAVALPTPLDEGNALPSETVSRALSSGWVWKIPLTNRFGNGYVYSSDFLTEDAAETELRTHLGLLESDVEARHLKMRIGRTEQCWSHNCLAVGLAQGFIEPLEATALMIVQDTVETFIQRFEQGRFTDRYKADVNEKINLIFDGVRNYIFTHYKLNSREDSEYWTANRENEHVPEDVARIFQVWDRGADLLGELRNQAMRLVYSPTSWYCILAGMGRFPRRPKRPKRSLQVYDAEALRRSCSDIARGFPDHRELLRSMAEGK